MISLTAWRTPASTRVLSLLDLLWPRRRKYHVALTMLLAQYTYDQLNETERQNVDGSVKRLAEHSRADSFQVSELLHKHRYGLIAAALHEAGIPPAVPGEQWAAGMIAFTLTVRADDPQFHRAMEDARRYLTSKGISLHEHN